MQVAPDENLDTRSNQSSSFTLKTQGLDDEEEEEEEVYSLRTTINDDTPQLLKKASKSFTLKESAAEEGCLLISDSTAIPVSSALHNTEIQ